MSGFLLSDDHNFHFPSTGWAGRMHVQRIWANHISSVLVGVRFVSGSIFGTIGFGRVRGIGRLTLGVLCLWDRLSRGGQTGGGGAGGRCSCAISSPPPSYIS